MESIGVVSEPDDRCRLMLAAGPGICVISELSKALAAGDVASVILCDRSDAPIEFFKYCEIAVPIIQEVGAAALVNNDSQIMGRSGADGLYIQQNQSSYAELIARFSPQKIVGCGGMMDRDAALRIGELFPDFVLLGKLGRDIKPEPHPKNLAIATWWAEFVELPGVLPGGADRQSVRAAAETGIDFVILEKAIFGNADAPDRCVSQVNEILEKHSPRFSDCET